MDANELDIDDVSDVSSVHGENTHEDATVDDLMYVSSVAAEEVPVDGCAVLGDAVDMAIDEDKESSDEEMDDDISEAGEAIRRAVEGGEVEYDEDGMPIGGSSGVVPPRTRNEVSEESVLIPAELPTHLPSDAELVVIGHVLYHIVAEKTLVLQGVHASRELVEVGALVSAVNREVLGVVIDVFGPLVSPHYAVRVTSASDILPGASLLAVRSSVVPSDAIAVAVKGSDASNMFDEEVAEEEMEFSDDEQEMLAKQNRRANSTNQRINAPQHTAVYQHSAQQIAPSLTNISTFKTPLPWEGFDQEELWEQQSKI